MSLSGVSTCLNSTYLLPCPPSPWCKSKIKKQVGPFYMSLCSICLLLVFSQISTPRLWLLRAQLLLLLAGQRTWNLPHLWRSHSVTLPLLLRLPPLLSFVLPVALLTPLTKICFRNTICMFNLLVRGLSCCLILLPWSWSQPVDCGAVI